MITDLYDKEFEVMNKTSTADSVGGLDVTWARVGKNFQARIEMLKGYERNVEQRRGLETSHRIYCDINNNITHASRLKDVETEEIFEVVYPDVLNGHHMEIIVSKIT